MLAELPSELEIQLFTRPIKGSITLPGSKSITNRALVLAALAQGKTFLENFLFCEDTKIMVQALQALGFDVQPQPYDRTCTIQGQAGHIPNNTADIFVGNAGTVARFILALCALHPQGQYHFRGSLSMNKRPMRGLIEVLQQQGCTFIFLEKAWHFPFKVKTQGLRGSTLCVDASTSSQILSALLMVAPFAKTPCTLYLKKEVVSTPFVKMTLKIMHDFGAPEIAYRQDFLKIAPCEAYHRQDLYNIEPDATAASYFCALIALHSGTLYLPGFNLHTVQGDSYFLQLIQPLGLTYQYSSTGCYIHSQGLKPGPLGWEVNMNSISDTFLTLAALAPLLENPLTIYGLKHTRYQECDRVLAIAQELKRLGQNVSITQDSITIKPQPITPAKINTYEDHRMAMSFSVLGTYDFHNNGIPWLTIKKPGCCQKTFPNFFETLESLRCKNHL